MQRDARRNQRRVSFQTSPLCPLAWTPGSSPRSLQKTGKLREASRNCGGSESKPSRASVFAILSSANSLDLCVYRTGLDAASPAARLRSMTRNWAISKEEASDRQPVPDWPDQQTPGNTPARAWTRSLETFSLGQLFIFCRFFSSCQQPEAAFRQVEHRAGVRVAGGNRTRPVRHRRSPLGHRRADAAVSHATRSRAGRILAKRFFRCLCPAAKCLALSVRSTCPIALCCLVRLFGV